MPVVVHPEFARPKHQQAGADPPAEAGAGQADGQGRGEKRDGAGARQALVLPS